MIIHTNLHYNLHEFYARLIFWIQLPYHLICHKQPYGFVLTGFILCDEPCGYCFDLGYNPSMNCRRCYDNGKWIRWP